MSLVVWYHDPSEVDRRTSWTGLTPSLVGAAFKDISVCREPGVLSLYSYARPDAVISEGGKPIISIEQTMMNPSGHNMPQRFSCLAAAAEQGVAGILYHPEFARRTFSDPNPRYANPRVALAQKHMNGLFPASPPSLSVFWPTCATTMLPDTSQMAQANLAAIVQELIVSRPTADEARNLPAVSSALSEMDRVIESYGDRIKPNDSFRKAFPRSEPHWLTPGGRRIDPPGKARFLFTNEVLSRLCHERGMTDEGIKRMGIAAERTYSLSFAATLNGSRNDSEHPWPGYFSLLDMLYARCGPSRSERLFTMVFDLPLQLATYTARLDRGLVFPRIIDGVADLVVLSDGVVAGGFGSGDPLRILSS